MKLALVYPPFSHKTFNENLLTVDEEFGVFPHIGFGYVSREAKAVGWDVRLFDAAARKLTYEQLSGEITSYSPDLIAYSAHAVQTFRDLLDWARKIGLDLEIPTLVGGFEARHYPKEIMTHQCFHFLCAGEAKDFVGPFLRAFEEKTGFDKVPDLYYRNNGEVKYTFPSASIHFRDLDIPDRSIFDHKLYHSHVSQRQNFTIAMSSRGCPYDCSFCCMSNTGFQGRTAEQVYSEMRDCVVNYGIHEIDFFDPVMLHQKPRIMELAGLINNEKLDVIWSTRARIDSLTADRRSHHPDERFIEALAQSGCKRLFIGIESGEQAILDKINKNISINQLKGVLSCLNDHGIMPLGFFMLGNPGETKETIKKTVDLACSLPLKYAQFMITTIKPHTELEAQYIQEIFGFDFWREYIKGTLPKPLEDQPLPAPWTTIPREELEREAKKAYVKFYFRPGYVFGMLFEIKSARELLRYVKVALRLLIRSANNQRIVTIPAGRKVRPQTFFKLLPKMRIFG